MDGRELGRRPGGREAFVAAAVALAALWAAVPASGAPDQPTRYSLAGNCYTLASAAGQPVVGASQLRMQATRLGSYLLYGTAQDFLAASGDQVIHDPQPSPAADWTVEPSAAGTFTLSPRSAPGEVMVAHDGGTLGVAPRDTAGAEARLRFVPASDCAVYPEAELNVTGTPATGKTPYGEVQGLLDGHMHWMTFEYLGGNFHCGRPWDPYGIPYALPDCQQIEGPQGTAAPVQNFLNFGSPVAPHDTTGWPALTEWRRDNLTYEGTYYRWLERAWMAGLRMIAMPVNENRELCQLMVTHRNPCDEMNTVRLGIDDINQLQDYVDAQAGGPGKGFFQVVRNPFQARKVINSGKMAVVLEVEVSELFNCKGSDPSSCNKDVIDEGLDDLYDRGVRSSLLLNKFDNPLTGVRFDGGQIGALINAANRESYGSFWDAKTCTEPEHDNEIYSPQPQAGSFLADLMAQLGVPGGTAPAYPPGPHCNTRGLTDLGAHTVERMMDMGMIVNPDHMSQKAVDDTLTLAEARDYSGIISPHGWMDPRNWPRIFQLGGMAFPGAGSAAGFVDAWQAYRPKDTPQFFGWGYGADLGGLATQGAPAPEGSPNAVTYPFKSLDGQVTIDRQRTGDRVFDYSQEGVAHYGLYADWYEEVRKTGGPQIADDMLNGAEAYLQMWERAVGVPASDCKSDGHDFTARGLGSLRLGLKPRPLLESAGQPLRRKRAWSWCVAGSDGAAVQSAVMSDRGRVGLVASSAAGDSALGIAPGDSSGALEGMAEQIGTNLWTAPLRGSRVVFVVSHGVVRSVAVAKPSVARSPATLRPYLRAIPPKATPRSDTVVSPSSTKIAPAKAIPLAAQHGAAQFALFCGL